MLKYTPLEDIEVIVNTLRETFRSGTTKNLDWRKNQLKQMIKMLGENKNDIMAALQKDLKMDPLVTNSEVTGSIQECEDVLASLDSWVQPDKKNIPAIMKPGQAKIFKDPLGVVCLISPWNYPCSIIMRPLIGAVAAGNCVLLKPSEVSENTSEVMGRLITKYLDKKAIGVVQGAVNETSEVLKFKFDKILYTGNGTVGRIVMRAAAEHLTPVILELGGKSPLIIGPDVDMDKAIPRICWGKFLNCGQTCIAPDYAFVHHTRYEEFLSKLQAQIKEFYGDDPRKSSDYGKIINSRHTSRISQLVSSSGGKIVYGGEKDVDAAYHAPTIVTDVALDSPIMKDEIFGPVLPVFPMKELDEVIAFINDRPKPLALYVYSQNKAFIDKVLSETTSGGGCVNECIMHNICKELPFGGVGDSGMGAYNGRITFDQFSHHKGMLIRPQNSDVSLRFPPYTESKLKWLERIDGVTRALGKNKRVLLIGLVALLSYVLHSKFLS